MLNSYSLEDLYCPEMKLFDDPDLNYKLVLVCFLSVKPKRNFFE